MKYTRDKSKKETLFGDPVLHDVTQGQILFDTGPYVATDVPVRLYYGKALPHQLWKDG
jgi:hypothetical protein